MCIYFQEITKEDPHQLQLARLEWELKQRKELATQCNELKSEKKRVTADIKKKKTQLKNLAPMLKEILAVSKQNADRRQEYSFQKT